MKIKIYIFTLWLQLEDDKETMKKWYKLWLDRSFHGYFLQEGVSDGVWVISVPSLINMLNHHIEYILIFFTSLH